MDSRGDCTLWEQQSVVRGPSRVMIMVQEGARGSKGGRGFDTERGWDEGGRVNPGVAKGVRGVCLEDERRVSMRPRKSEFEERTNARPALEWSER